MLSHVKGVPMLLEQTISSLQVVAQQKLQYYKYKMI